MLVDATVPAEGRPLTANLTVRVTIGPHRRAGPGARVRSWRDPYAQGVAWRDRPVRQDVGATDGLASSSVPHQIRTWSFHRAVLPPAGSCRSTVPRFPLGYCG